jgi:predicted nucleic acid-binding protein
MVANLRVRAEVVDIKIDLPQPGDIFMVDTNAWYWIVYSRSSQASVSEKNQPKAYQTKHYPAYIKKAITAKAKLHYCGLTLSELAHNIEKIEKDIFSSDPANPTLKEYRHNHSTERAKVAAEVEASWDMVKAMGKLVSMTIDEETIDAALARFQSQPLDGYDLFMAEGMKAKSIQKIITDDGDFVTVPGIIVFTANQNMIRAAKDEGKLVNRLSNRPFRRSS